MDNTLKRILNDVMNNQISESDAVLAIERIKKDRTVSAPGKYGGAKSSGQSKSIIKDTVKIHSLLHRNTSLLSEQRFSTDLSGEEFFLKDHIVRGEKILPGVAYLEMVRAAVEASVEEPENQFVYLTDVAWLQPLRVTEKRESVHISLFPEENGKIFFEIYGESEGEEPALYSRGYAQWSRQKALDPVDAAIWKKMCSRVEVCKEECYALIRAGGIEHGESLQALETLYIGDKKALGRLRIPESFSGTLDQYTLHPALMDAALVATIGLSGGNEKGFPVLPTVPFLLEELEIYSRCREVMWAFVQYSEGSGEENRVRKYDIDLCDADGKVCVKMRGFLTRVMESYTERLSETIFLRPEWKERSIEGQGAPSRYGKDLVFFCNPEVNGKEFKPEGVQYFDLVSKEKHIGKRYGEYAVTLFEEIKKILKSGLKEEMLLQVVTVNGHNHLKGLSGLLKSAELENPRFKGQVIDVETGEDRESLALKLKDNTAFPEDKEIRYKNGKRYVLEWSGLEDIRNTGTIPWKEGGVYLITGGAGGLGFIFAKEIGERCKNARVILAGRSVITEEKKKHLQRTGGNAEYYSMDVRDKKSVKKMIDTIKSQYGKLDGIIHSAGIIRDNFMIKKTKDELEEVLGPKVMGAINLDEATSETELDFFIMFSSAAGVYGNIGQADYACGNAFMDSYAGYRNHLVREKKRFGRTLSINWPLWSEGGMKVDKETGRRLEKTWGMKSISTLKGLEAFYTAFHTKEAQILVVERIGPGEEKASVDNITAVKPCVNTVEEKDLYEKAEFYFKKFLSKAIKLSVNRIDQEAMLENYGLDSIMILDMTGELENLFGPLSKTLFFEYQTIRELTGYFIEKHKAKLIELLGLGEKEEKPCAETTVEKVPRPSSAKRRKRSGFRILPPEVKREKTPGALDIAVIGLSGKYPQAKNINEYWQNLCNGKDCITEIPGDRWDHSLYFDEDKNKPGKTYGKWGGFLDGVDQFDPMFFNISPREAVGLDPQERLFLECVYETLEDAGYTRDSLRSDVNGKVGVFAGVMYEEYQLYGAQGQVSGMPYALAGSPASIANRVSYYFNFHGPSMSVDTMCSSSLTTIHLACQSLKNGECRLAIAGGVNVSIHPNKYLFLAQGRFVSSKGRCESFGEGGDGYVPGEGVGAVLLKPLEEAKQSGDHIYGIIKGTSLNHGGKTNGYTVPNPNAQAEVISQAAQLGKIDFRNVSYLEAHGTGTSLGDPIEIRGLTKAFQENTNEKQYCSIGSVKSNIGHLESAAGIAGVTKVLLQMKYKKLVPSLHSGILNENIDFKDTPFVVQQQLSDWKRPVINGREYSRTAGVSAFGAGGSNAHVMIEEYVAPKERIVFTADKSVLIVLSAKDEERLKIKAEQLLSEIRDRGEEINLADMAYTLQVGREAMEERLGIIASSMTELAKMLREFTEEKEGNPEVYRGRVKEGKGFWESFTAKEDILAVIGKWMEQGEINKLAELWVKGLELDWRQLYEKGSRQIISLPTYPFAKERWWIPVIKQKKEADNKWENTIHPLLHVNRSTFSGQQYSTVFTGEEFYLRDHRVRGKKVLPGVVCLEMAYAAVLASLREEPGYVILLENIAWMKPVEVADNTVGVHIVLYEKENEKIIYEIFENPDESGEKVEVFSRGYVQWQRKEQDISINLENIKQSCGQGKLLKDECYGNIERSGIKHGEAMRGLNEIYLDSRQVLAKLILPPSVSDTFDQYKLHPALMDGALVAIIGLLRKDDAESNRAIVPFALEELEVYDSLLKEMWAWVRFSKGSSDSDSVRKYDIDLCDDQGKVYTRIKGFSTRVIDITSDKLMLTEFYEPCWNEKEISLEETTLSYNEHVVLLCGLANFEIESKSQKIRYVSFLSDKQEIDKRYVEYAAGVFEEIKAVLMSTPKSTVLIQIVAAGETGLMSGLSGILKSVCMENPQFKGQVIEIEQGEDRPGILQKIEENAGYPMDVDIRYEMDKRYVLDWKVLEEWEEPGDLPWIDGGVYLITGGTGGLGLILAREIADRTKGCKIILTGRSVLTEEKKTALEKIKGDTEYLSVDVTDKNAVRQLIQKIKKDHGNLNGIIHSAGIIRDNFVIKKTTKELEEVLGPKVNGIVNLDEASKTMPLDFFIVFSSVAGVTGNVGQADYACGNAFADRYTVYRSNLVKRKKRHGKSLSINWPLWAEGGMKTDKETEKIILEKLGLVPLSTKNGIMAFYKAFQSKANQVFVLGKGFQKEKEVIPEKDVLIDQTSLKIDEAELLEKSMNYFKKLLSKVIQLPSHRIDVEAPMETYGIDSIMILNMTDELEKKFGPLSKTLFFEHQTIRAITGYFLDRYKENLIGLLNIEVEKEDKETGKVPEKTLYPHSKGLRFKFQTGERKGDDRKGPLDIAIIGLSGRYPQSANLEEFWRILKEGEDCITEIPKERWDHSLYFDEDKNKPGKTYSRWGGFIEGVDLFDPMFFNISPREAEFLDPQERLFLQCAYETLEDAGYTRESLRIDANGEVGVFAGVMYEEYQLYGAQGQISGFPYALSGNSASIANRVSYFCDFHGPSMSVDTMCSSSLTTIHLACQSLKNGECRLAIAGGVNVSIHPNKYLLLAQGKFSSSKGRCESFGEGGDGYVPGEGVGAVLLKPLKEAVKSGDHIYGVIKGTALNHGGKTNGYSVPNPEAQTIVIGEALKRSKIDPRRISYIEAHGTGTSLGDPIEIAGLTKAFGEYTGEYCVIGSVKSNIGHLESAAGIAGVTKVLLQIKNRKLVPSLHSKVLNRNIDFDKIPFKVQQELSEWKRPVIEGEEVPRTAGISSFGAGGANAHVVIEEYVPDEDVIPQVIFNSKNPAVIIISARDVQRLREKVRQLFEYLCRRESDIDLADIAYTLQVGREAMEERLAVVAASIAELKNKLEDFIGNKEGIFELYQGRAKSGTETLELFTADEELQEAIEKWIERNKTKKIAELWVKGLKFDWKRLYTNGHPRLISLPTYPFARERYWLPEVFIQKRIVLNGQGRIHPLVHHNISTLSEQRYSVTFTGDEFFFNSRAVQGLKCIPEIVLVEMARAAIEASLEEEEKTKGIILKKVTWMNPLAVGHKSVNVKIGLGIAEEEKIIFEIFSEFEHKEAIIHCRGFAELCSIKNQTVMDLDGLKAVCRVKSFDKNGRSEKAAAVVEEFYEGKNSVLMKLLLPESLKDSSGDYTLHPAVLDGVVKGILAVIPGEEDNKNKSLAAIEEIEIIDKNSEVMWVRVEWRKKHETTRIIADMCNESGEVCVRLKGIDLSEKKRIFDKDEIDPDEEMEIFRFEERWEEESREDTVAGINMNSVLCFLSQEENKKEITKQLKALNEDVDIIFVSREEKDNYAESLMQAGGVDLVLYLWACEDKKSVKEYGLIVDIIRGLKTGGKRVKQILSGGLYTDGLEKCYLESWIGFARSLGLVLPDTESGVVIIDAKEETPETGNKEWLRIICEEIGQRGSVLYEDGKRHVCKLRKKPDGKEKLQLRENGTYLITGGTGGLGLIFAEYLAEKYSAHLILTGRSPMDERKAGKIKGIEEKNGKVLYVQADVCSKKDMTRVIKEGHAILGNIHGVIHAAGIQSEQVVYEKTKESFEKVLAPKIAGTMLLDEVLNENELDFICYFSSTSAILGDFGSCDYAVGNRFQVAYGDYRNHDKTKGKRIVINWPLWKDGGMGFKGDEGTQMYLKTSGQRLLESHEGIALFEQAVKEGRGQQIILAGQEKRIYRFLGLLEEGKKKNKSRSIAKAGKGRTAAMKGWSLSDCFEWDLKEEISRLLKIEREQIDADVNLSDFGFDSISLTEYGKILSHRYDIEISPALFYGYSTINKLINFFMKEHKIRIEDFYREEARVEESAEKEEEYVKTVRRSIARKPGIQRSSSAREPVAVIGMSGRFPGARNIEELWRVLHRGEEKVGEVGEAHFGWKGDEKWRCGFLEGVSEFDPLFFEISPMEAGRMDPRQRLLLQEAWRALEDAGYGKRKLAESKTGMYVGVEEGDYGFVSNGGSITSNATSVLAARLGYFLDLNGPVMAINTACSSGLVAAHQACMSLWNGECDTAIAAGINLLLSPISCEGMNAAGMLSEDGKSYVFDKRANGMVPGEAVAVVVFKRLSRAEADGDHIYGVIKGSGINYDGKTNGLTAPNGVAQAALMKSVYDEFKVNPENIEYIVTHGTGTKLGDPVEINALNDAFKTYTQKSGFCALTSTKTNFGHTLAASGLVSLISLLLALKYEEIPASLNCSVENDYINWKESPFYVNKTIKKWPARKGEVKTGAVSSFGMSGTNAHMVVESYIDKEVERSKDQSPGYLLVLSAKRIDVLENKIKEIVAYFEGREKDAYPESVSSTLLCGRHHFKYRCAIVAEDIEDAVTLWKKAVGKEKLPNLFRGEVARDFREQKAIKQFGNDLIDKKQASKEMKDYYENLCVLANLFCQGYELDWSRLFGYKKIQAISLPAYPFARETYLIPGNKIMTRSAVSVRGEIHPFLHCNTSTLSEQRYTTLFTGENFYLPRNGTGDTVTLSDAIHIEMARAAVCHSLERERGSCSIRLFDIRWINSIRIYKKSIPVHIGIYEEKNGQVNYEIYGDTEENDSVYSLGSAEVLPFVEPISVNLDALKQKCNGKIFSKDDCRKVFREKGIAYEKSMYELEEVYKGTDAVLVSLKKTVSLSSTIDQYGVHPSLMDSALMAAAMFLKDDEEQSKASFAFSSIDELVFHGFCGDIVWAYIEFDEEKTEMECGFKHNLDFMDETGKILLTVKGFSLKVGENNKSEPDDIVSEKGGKETLSEEKSVEKKYSLKKQTLNQLKAVFSNVSKISIDQIDSDEPLESYGVDSMMITGLNQELAGIFSELAKLLFYENKTLKAAADFLVDHYEAECLKWTGLEDTVEMIPKPVKVKEENTAPPLMKETRTRRRIITDRTCGNQDGIAIIGITGRYPQARNLKEFWQNLKNGNDSITVIPETRWKLDDFYIKDIENAVKQGKSYSKWGGFVDGFSEFDPFFFNISPREAGNMDPQERLFLQSCWEVMEDAGYTRERFRDMYESKVGVFAGITKTGFALYGPDLWKHGESQYPHTSFGSVANRVSYIMNFSGPSLPIDTMCSSSLTAIHEACEHLYRGDCEMAIAGGVNLYLHPTNYVEFCLQRMLSKDGKCKSFGAEGDGFVPGEGVGCVLLKPIKNALSDGDQIYGIIKGTAINHGGRTTGYSVPNPRAQGELIAKALEKAGVNARSVSYIEAHGTGTKLGDPIEIAGLDLAFKKHTRDTGFCMIGSVKTNIGNPSAAAGIAGLTKVILQMKHEQLVPSLNSKEINPDINFTKTPFVVQQRLMEWKRPVIDNKEHSRIAGISSFGAGGLNAHVIIEEYTAKEKETVPIVLESKKNILIVLSAKNSDRLKEKVQQLLDHLFDQKEEIRLIDLAYTLQIGREAMEERIAVITESIEELMGKLKSFLNGQENILDFHRGHTKKGNEILDMFMAEEDWQNHIGKWIKECKIKKLAELWVKGFVIDWKQLYGENIPSIISLPAYPFGRDNYWISMPQESPLTNNFNQGQIHPLLHTNTSDLSEQRYSTLLTGDEFYLRDHVVSGRNILPGVAYLEMARTAIETASSRSFEDTSIVKLKNIVWIRTLAVDKTAVNVNTGLYAEENGDLTYKIYSVDGDKNIILHNQGSAELIELSQLPAVDIDVLKSRCNRGSISSEQCYAAFEVMGIHYGPGHRGVEKIYLGEDYLLANLSLPAAISETRNQYILHPSLMDSAFQSAIGLLFINNKSILPVEAGSLKPYIPFAIKELEVLHKCTSSMWAYIRYSDGSLPGDKVQKLDIDICDESGNVCISIKEFTSRMLDDEPGRESGLIKKYEKHGCLLLGPVWETKEAVFFDKEPEPSKHVVFLFEEDDRLKNSLMNRIDSRPVFIAECKESGIDVRYKYFALKVFEELQRIIKENPKGTVFIQVVISLDANEENRIFFGLSGMLKSAGIENPKIIGQVIGVQEGTTGIYEKLTESRNTPEDSLIWYRGNERLVKKWMTLRKTENELAMPWNAKGCYLITGGCGGLGLIFAEEIARRITEGILVLTGRSRLSEEKKTRLKELREKGLLVVYKQVDVREREAVERLIRNIETEYGKLNGIVHSAGVIHDNFIMNKTKEELENVFDVKIKGLKNLDEASKDLKLDFFILFSSIAGALGSMGQSDYACANSFMDFYSSYRNTLVGEKKRFGKTMSINWPLWKEGGMTMDKQSEKMMRQTIGLAAMKTETGIRSFYKALVSGKDQVMVLEGETGKITTVLEPILVAHHPQDENQTGEAGVVKPECNGSLAEKVQTVFMRAAAGVLKVKLENIDAEVELNEYGFDSITFTELVNNINQDYNWELAPTIFFEYPTIKSLVEFLVKEYHDLFAGQFGVQLHSGGTVQELKKTQKEALPGKKRTRNFVKKVKASESTPGKSVPIAIVGMSGMFPMSEDIDEFWNNLLEGKDCISEIPADRWDWRDYYGDPQKEANKTNIKWGGFVDGISEFDPLFFGISPREAMLMDPPQRLLMMYVWKAIEDAGYSAQSLSGTKTGIFVGTSSSGYGGLIAMSNIAIEGFSSTGSVPSVGPNRMSYFLNIHGPSEPIETACSSSLVAIHRAVTSIREGACEMAVVGGINTIVTPDAYISFSKAGMLCEDGRCKTFSDKADGYVRGEGVGMLLLKKLDEAEKMGDHIYGVIRAVTVNHGGRANSLTAPNPNAQAELLKTAYAKTGFDPRSITYIEAHGTGTKLGDPIEINGLKKAFKELYQSSGNKDVVSAHCGLGSVKTNIGHLELAAGIAGVIKVLLQIKHKTLVKSLHCNTINPFIKLQNSPFYINGESKEWKCVKDSKGKELPRRTGVSSFGFGGVNAHVVIEEYIPEEKPSLNEFPVHPAAIIVLSARTAERLKEQAKQLLAVIEKGVFSDRDLPDISYTLQVGRDGMEERMAVIVESVDQLKEKLSCFIGEEKQILNLYRGRARREKEVVDVSAVDERALKTINRWIGEKEYHELAEFWVKGNNFDWNTLYTDRKPRRISLPTYPFIRDKYWVKPVPANNVPAENVQVPTGKAEDAVPGSLHSGLGIISEVTGVIPEKLDLKKSLTHYGIDSILFIQLFQKLNQFVDPTLNVDKLRDCESLQDVLNILNEPAKDPRSSKNNSSSALKVSRFYELIHLNSVKKKRPVFWFHSGVGGVEVYQTLAQRSSRPFYGIQARGWMTSRTPLHGIPAMAAYYVHIIQSVQPQGPYDFGGYSLGGDIAYEVTRQLQELGEDVNSIVMIDSMDSETLNRFSLSPKSIILQNINTTFFSKISFESEDSAVPFIHRDELNPDLNEDDFFKQVISQLKKHGKIDSEEKAMEQIQKNFHVRQGYDFKNFQISPLPDSSSINCYYFRNKNGLVFGELEPYMVMDKTEIESFNHSEYWKGWTKQFPGIHIMDVDASNHMTMLSDPKASEIIYRFCEMLYSDEPLSGAEVEEC